MKFVDCNYKVFRSIPSQCRFYILLPLLLFICQTCSKRANIENDHEILVDGRLERTYFHDLAPIVNPYHIEAGPIFGEDQSTETYFLQNLSPWWTTDNEGCQYIYDRGEDIFHQFSPNGDYLRHIGKEGRGPGKFIRVSAVSFFQGELHVFDNSLQRLSVFNTNGVFLRSLQLPGTPRIISLVPYLSDDIKGLAGYSNRITEIVGKEISDFGIHIFSENGVLSSTIIDTTFQKQYPVYNRRVFYPPYELHGTRTELNPNYPVVWTTSHDFRLNFLNPKTQEEWVVRIEREPRPITNAMKSKVYAEYKELGVEAAARRTLRFSEGLPEIDYMRWDTSGRLWVRQYHPYNMDAESYRFDVFDINGLWLFRQDLPPFIPMQITADRFYALDTTEDGTPIIRCFIFTKEH